MSHTACRHPFIIWIETHESSPHHQIHTPHAITIIAVTHTHTHTHTQGHTRTYTHARAPSLLLPPLISHFQSLGRPATDSVNVHQPSALPWRRSWKSLQLFQQRQKKKTLQPLGGEGGREGERERGMERERGRERERERERKGVCVCV